MLKTAAARVMLELGAQYDSQNLFHHADRAERLARMIIAAGHDQLDDATFDYLWGLSDDKPEYEWQTPGPGEYPKPSTPVVTREQGIALQAADGHPELSAPHQGNMSWGEYTSSQQSAQQAARQQQGGYSVPLDSHGSPQVGLKTKGRDGKFDGGFESVEDIRARIKREEHSRQPARHQSYAPQGVPAMAGA